MQISSILSLAAAFVATANASSVFIDEFQQFMEMHGKTYSSDHEHTTRRAVFYANKREIDEHNARTDVSYKLGINQFSDLTNVEFRALHFGKVHDHSGRVVDSEHAYVPVNKDLPVSVDWRDVEGKNYVSPVKDQGQCGSCWAFSTTGSIESAYRVAKKGRPLFSEQQLVDCSSTNDGCEGGMMDNAFTYVIQKGLETEAEYSYSANEHKCKYAPKLAAGSKITTFKDVATGDIVALQNAIAFNGPVSVAIDASSFHFQSYKSGVFVNSACSDTELDHGVLAVGYGTSEDGKDYWIIKNSWATHWGMDGYILMLRDGNQCGVATSASFPIV